MPLVSQFFATNTAIASGLWHRGPLYSTGGLTLIFSLVFLVALCVPLRKTLEVKASRELTGAALAALLVAPLCFHHYLDVVLRYFVVPPEQIAIIGTAWTLLLLAVTLDEWLGPAGGSFAVAEGAWLYQSTMPDDRSRTRGARAGARSEGLPGPVSREFNSPSRFQLRPLLDSIPGLVWVAAVEREQILLANRRFCHYTGLYEEDANVSQLESLIHPDDRGDWSRAFHQAASERVEARVELRLRGALDQQHQWMVMNLAPGDAELSAGATWTGIMHPRTGVEPSPLPTSALDSPATVHGALLESTFEDAPVGLVLWDRDLRIVKANRAFSEMCGVSRQALFGRSLSEVVPGLPSVIAATLAEVMRSGEAVRGVEARIPLARLRSSRSTWKLSLFPVSTHGAVEHVAGLIDDVTRQKQHESSILRGLHLLSEVVDALPLAVVVLDQNGLIREVNRSAVEFTHASGEELEGRFFLALPLWREEPESQQRVSQLWSTVAEGKSPFAVTEVAMSDGQYLELTIARMRESSQESSFIAVWLDVSQRRTTEQALRTSEAAFRALAQSIPHLCWAFRPNGEPDFFNDNWLSYTGLPPAGAGGDSWLDIVHPEDRDVAEQRWKSSLASGGPLQVEIRMRRAADGKYRWFLMRANPLLNESAEILRWFGTCTDIDDQRRNAESLMRANQDLEHFAYAASHDLQEPLRSMLLFAQILQQRHGHLLDPEGHEVLRHILASGARMRQLLQDLKALLQSGQKPPVDLPVVDTRDVVDEVLSNLTAAVEGAGATVTIDALPNLRMERGHLSRLMQNLVSNALKYRSHRPVEVHIGGSDQGGEFVFFVRDNGIGIRGEYRETIFSAFQRLHGRDFPGSGLGLTICRRIVLHYGGRIWVEETPGGGSCFYFTAPAARL